MFRSNTGCRYLLFSEVRQAFFPPCGRVSTMKRFLSGLVALGLLMSLSGNAKAQPSYIYTTLDVPGATLTSAFGINPSGEIVGAYRDAAFKGHGFLLDKGSYTTLDVP